MLISALWPRLRFLPAMKLYSHALLGLADAGALLTTEAIADTPTSDMSILDSSGGAMKLTAAAVESSAP